MAQTPTTTKPRIALTTIFTPPPSCLSTVTYDGTTAWQNGVRQTGDPNCYPASFADILNSFYSPGICPNQWTQAHMTTSSTVTVAFCCPSDYTLYTTSAHILLANYCFSSLETAISTVASVPSQTIGPLPTSPKLVTLQPSKAANSIVYADVIQIRYQSSDTKVVNLMTATAVPKSAASGTMSIQSATASVSRSSGDTDNPAVSAPPETASSNLSTGAKAGIGIGVALGVIALVGIAALFLLKKRRTRMIQPYSATPVDQGDNPRSSEQVQQGVQARKLAEMDAPLDAQKAELDTLADQKRVEMDARVIQEMPGSKVVTELSAQ